MDDVKTWGEYVDDVKMPPDLGLGTWKTSKYRKTLG